MSSENLPPRTLTRVAREVRNLHKNPPEGIQLVVDSETGVPASLAEVTAEIQGPTGTPYEKKYFQLKLVLSSDFPASPPRGYFTTKIYHPNVDNSTGAICVNTLKKDWTSETTFSHVLSVIRCLMIVPFPESSLNDEAGKLFMESYDEYAKRARLMAGVHGRPHPFTGDEDEDESSSSSADDEKDNNNNEVVGGNSGSNSEGKPLKQKNTLQPTEQPLRSKTSKQLSRSNSATSNTSSKKLGSKAGDKKNKKKSLKRL